jgi:hypothetical protein
MFLWLQIIALFFFLNLDQGNEFVWKKDIQVQCEFFATDQFKNVYSIDKNQLTKHSFSDNTTSAFSSKLNGIIHSVDVSDPFRLLVFYKDFNRIVFLDNKLSELGSNIRLNDLGYFHVVASATSTRGGFWIYDQGVSQLVFIDKSLQVGQVSSTLSDLIDNSMELKKISLIEKNDFVYLGIPDQGIIQFDAYATFIKKFPITDFADFQVVGQNVVYLSNGKLKVYNTENYQTEEKILPVDNIKDCRVEGSELFLLLNDRISIYNIHN